ncbi:MAG: hypothetical protein ABI454_06980 [Sphingomicrobium sp.]
MRLLQLLTRAEQFNERARPNDEYVVALARPLGIQPILEPQLQAPGPADGVCQPLLATIQN